MKNPHDNVLRYMLTLIFGTWGVGCLAWLAFWGAIIYVALHFVLKFW